MRIDAYNQVNQVYKSDGKLKTQKVKAVKSNDKVEISEFGKILQTAKQAVSASSDVREDKIAQLKAQIDNDTYEVSGESFAEKILEKYQNFGKM